MTASTADPRVEQARLLYSSGKVLETKQLCLQVLADEPTHDEALCLLSALAKDGGDLRALKALAGYCQNVGRSENALNIYEAVLFVSPSDEEARSSLGELLAGLNRPGEALEAYRAILDHHPQSDGAYVKMGALMHQLGRHQEGIEHCLKALQINPNSYNACFILGKILRDTRMTAQAITCFRKTISLNPGCASAHNSLGAALFEVQQIEEADLCFQAALEIDPNYPGAHYNRSLVLLLRGDYCRGWQEFEWRWKADAFRDLRRDFPQPRWHGESLEGRTILLHAEQGFGDTLQFVRFIPQVQACGGKVVVECQPELETLLKAVFQGCQVVAKGRPLPASDFHCPLLSLPSVFHTTLETIPGPVPYLWAERGKIESWRAKMASDRSRLKAGLVWSGGKGVVDHKRSISLATLSGLATVKAASFYSLRKKLPNSAPGQPDDTSPGLQLADLTDGLADFAETAAFIANLDLVISVDTSVAHLAGAMGKPVWVLLPDYAEWRWSMTGEESPWYPTMRLFRHSEEEGWKGAIQRVVEALSALVETSGS